MLDKLTCLFFAACLLLACGDGAGERADTTPRRDSGPLEDGVATPDVSPPDGAPTDGSERDLEVPAEGGTGDTALDGDPRPEMRVDVSTDGESTPDSFVDSAPADTATPTADSGPRSFAIMRLRYDSEISGAEEIADLSGLSVFHLRDNHVSLGGEAGADVVSIAWTCESGCNQSGTVTPSASWETTPFYLEAGTNRVTFTAGLQGGGNIVASFDLYRTVASGVTLSFPYSLNFDSGPDTLEARYTASKGATVTHQTTGCYSGGCAKFVPSAIRDSYCGLSGFQFAGTPQTIHVRYLIYFGPDFQAGLAGTQSQRMKHVLIHRGSDISGDRAMAYLRPRAPDEIDFRACDNTDCGGDDPPAVTRLTVGMQLERWLAIEYVFDTSTHMVRGYATTRDRAFDQTLIAERGIHSISPSLDHWSFLSILGGYMDWGSVPSAGMYWLIDELVISDGPIGPPAGF